MSILSLEVKSSGYDNEPILINAVLKTADGDIPVVVNEGAPEFPELVAFIENLKKENENGEQEVNEELLQELYDKLLEVYSPFRRVTNSVRDIDTKITYRNNAAYINDEKIDDSILHHLIKLQDLGKTDEYARFEKFVENIYLNLNEFIREQFFAWILTSFNNEEKLQLTEDGCFIAYKGLEFDDDESDAPPESRSVRSIFSGKATVNGQLISGKIPQTVGDIVEMPLSHVAFDPKQACSTGLHAGTWRYASNFGQIVYAVKVNPADVVSVPHDEMAQKIRTTKYEVLGFTPGLLEENQDFELEYVQPREWCADCQKYQEDCDCPEIDEDEWCYECDEHFDNCICSEEFCENCEQPEWRCECTCEECGEIKEDCTCEEPF